MKSSIKSALDTKFLEKVELKKAISEKQESLLVKKSFITIFLIMHTNRKLHSAKKDIDCTVLYPSCVLKNKNPALLFLKVIKKIRF